MDIFYLCLKSNKRHDRVINVERKKFRKNVVWGPGAGRAGIALESAKALIDTAFSFRQARNCSHLMIGVLITHCQMVSISSY